jgi:glycosyltransferase involved in cell wall biosynthesis
MKLSIIIPCFNEAETIREVLKRVERIEIPEKEIIVVDDGSTDETREILLEPAFSGGMKIIFHEKNLGKGAALNTGFTVATGDVLVVQDADFEYDPNELPVLLAKISEEGADVVYGSRFYFGTPESSISYWHVTANRFLTGLSNLFTGLRLTDMETCYKMFRKEVIDSMKIEEKRFGFEPEITAKIGRRGYRIREVPISYRGRTGKQGKKIGWKDGVSAIRAIVKYNTWHRN